MRQWLMCRGAFKQRSCILQCESMVGTFFLSPYVHFLGHPISRRVMAVHCGKKTFQKAFDIL